MPSVELDSMRRSMSDSAFSSAPADHLKGHTFEDNRSVRNLGGAIGRGGATGRVVATMIRFATSAAIVVMTKMKASISMCQNLDAR